MDESRILQLMPGNVNADRMLQFRGRHLTTTMLMQVGEAQFLIHIRHGAIEKVQSGPFVMASWQFSLRGDGEAWRQFWEPLPPPGFHDVMAMLKSRRLRLEGDLHPFMSHLLYFKGVLASIRKSEAEV